MDVCRALVFNHSVSKTNVVVREVHWFTELPNLFADPRDLIPLTCGPHNQAIVLLAELPMHFLQEQIARRQMRLRLKRSGAL
jgi:hypothetical protein